MKARDLLRLVKRLQFRDDKLNEGLIELLNQFSLLRCDYDKLINLLKLKIYKMKP